MQAGRKFLRRKNTLGENTVDVIVQDRQSSSERTLARGDHVSQHTTKGGGVSRRPAEGGDEVEDSRTN